MKWFDYINSASDAECILAGYCLCRHAPEHHRDGRCSIDSCAVECIIPPPPKLVEEARQFLQAIRWLADADRAQSPFVFVMMGKATELDEATGEERGIPDDGDVVARFAEIDEHALREAWEEHGGGLTIELRRRP